MANKSNESNESNQNNENNGNKENSETWYLLKVRSGFEPVVTRRLRSRGLEVTIPERKTLHPIDTDPEANPADCYLFCQFALEKTRSITNIPGVLCILSDPIPAPDGDLSALLAAVG